jgi:hypothetical protein
MHLLGCADNRIDRACLNTQGAADAGPLINHRNRPLAFYTIDQIERNNRLTQQRRDTTYAFGSAGRALIMSSGTNCNCLGIRATCRVTAFGALGLRQHIFDAIGERFSGIGHSATLSAICKVQEREVAAAVNAC